MTASRRRPRCSGSELPGSNAVSGIEHLVAWRGARADGGTAASLYCQAPQKMHTIRRAILEDAPTMFDLQRRAFAEEGRRSGTQNIPPLTELLDAVIEHIHKQTALVAWDHGKIIGTIRGIVKGRVCTVRALAVEPANQGRGIGSALLNALEHALPDVEQFDLTTNTVMEGNVPFYERHGYRVTELTRHSDLVTLAQMTKVVARGT
jgi:ribosomal protein S18 acetylase RimI-like enzyme